MHFNEGGGDSSEGDDILLMINLITLVGGNRSIDGKVAGSSYNDNNILNDHGFVILHNVTLEALDMKNEFHPN